MADYYYFTKFFVFDRAKGMDKDGNYNLWEETAALSLDSYYHKSYKNVRSFCLDIPVRNEAELASFSNEQLLEELEKRLKKNGRKS